MSEVIRLFAARENGLAEAAVGGWASAPHRLVEGLLAEGGSAKSLRSEGEYGAKVGLEAKR